MGKETRKGLEFGSRAKREIKRKTNGRCAVTNSKSHLEKHHIIPCWAYRKYLEDDPTVNKNIIKSSLNGLLLRDDVHDQLHSEMSNWADWAVQTYVVGLYAALEEEYYKGAMPNFKPYYVGHRKLTDNKL